MVTQQINQLRFVVRLVNFAAVLLVLLAVKAYDAFTTEHYSYNALTNHPHPHPWRGICIKLV